MATGIWEIHHSTWLLHPQHNNQGCGVLKVEVSSSITWLNVREFPYINDWSSCVDKGCASAALGLWRLIISTNISVLRTGQQLEAAWIDYLRGSGVPPQTTAFLKLSPNHYVFEMPCNSLRGPYIL